MPWDFEEDGAVLPRMQTSKPASPRDPETIVVLLQIATIFLSDEKSSFTKEDILSEMWKIAGPECVVREDDLEIVLPYCGFFLKKNPDGRYQQIIGICNSL